jgi:hypothetical protein
VGLSDALDDRQAQTHARVVAADTFCAARERLGQRADGAASDDWLGRGHPNSFFRRKHTLTLIGILVLIAIIWLLVVLIGGLPPWLLLLLLVLVIVWFVGGRGRAV